MANDFDDRLRERLNALGSDVAGSRLPGPGAARRRAAQRTRNQITGTVLAGVAVVAFGVIGLSQDELFTAPDPVSPTDTESPTAVPSLPNDQDDTDSPNPPDDTDPPPDGTSIPDGAFLTADDITPEVQPGDAFPEWVEGDATETPFDCAPAVPEGAEHRYYSNERDGHFLQFIEETEDPVARFSELRADLEQCVRDLELSDQDPYTKFTQIWDIGGLGDEAWMANYFAEVDEPVNFVETYLVSVRLMRAGDHVTVVVEGGPSQEDNADMETERSRQSGERLCAAFGTECVGDVTPRQVYPEPSGDIPGWLTLDDVVEITGLDRLNKVSEPLRPESHGPGGWPLIALPLDPVSDGATSFELRGFTDGSEPGGLMLNQTIATFPDDDAARAHYEKLVAAGDEFERDDDVVTNTGSVDEEDFSATTWRLEDPSTGLVFVYGVAVQGNQVTLVDSIQDYEDRDLTPEQLTTLLTRAADQLRSAR